MEHTPKENRNSEQYCCLHSFNIKIGVSLGQ